jgi:subtilisin family serine protease
MIGDQPTQLFFASFAAVRSTSMLRFLRAPLLYSSSILVGLSLLILSIVSLSIAALGQQPDLPGSGMRDRTPQYVSNQILVRFRDAAVQSRDAAVQSSSQQSRAMTLGKTLRAFSAVPGLQLVELAPGVDFNAALAAYRSDPSVLYAEPNYIRKALDNAPNDLYFRDLWSMHNTGQLILFPYPPFYGPKTATPGADIHALEAWSITTGSSDVVLGLIDTGVDVKHEDLVANIYRNEADCNNNGVDDDGNGYVDDCYGINTLDGNSDVTDIVDHGTHVAGIMGAAGNNGLGVAGVNWKAKILTCRFLGIYGGTDDGAIGCFNYMAAMKDRGVNIVATNNSWGGYGYSQALFDAIDGMRKRGILVVAAAGNSISDNDGLYPLYPASFALDNIIAVAASDFTDGQSYYSNFGTHTVSISAPGDEILSTTPDSSYSVFSGTSMATPHVTGVAALLKAQDPNRDWKAIRNLILAGGDRLSTVAASITGSRLNALNSLTCQNRTVSAPLQPQASSLLASTGQPLNISLLNINCGSPAGGAAVSIAPGGQQVNLHDDGVSPDQDSGDGIFSGQFTPSQSGLFTVAFPGGQQVQVAADPYTFSSSGFQYRSFSGTNLKLTDDGLAFLQSPFPISFAGGAYAGVYVSDNGYASFDSYAPATPSSLPYSYANTLIAPFWDNLVPTTMGNVYWTVNGTAPNRELVIEWRKMSHAGCKTDGTETVSFEVVFFENTTDLLFNYAKTAFGGTCTASDNGATAAAGVQATSKVAQQFSFKSAGLTANSAISWKSTLPSNAVPTITELNPKSWVTDINDLFVDVMGTKFNFNSVALVNGVPQQTYVFSSNELFVLVPASDLTTAGTTLQISVFNGSPGGGPSQAVALPINTADFNLSAAASGVTMKVGQSGTTTVYAYPNPAFQAGITLSCSGLPANVSCSFDPGKILAGGFAVLTFSSKPASSASFNLQVISSWSLCFPVVGLLWAMASKRRGRARRLEAKLAAVLLTSALLVSCGGGSSAPHVAPSPGGGGGSAPTSSPTTGTFSITVTGTSGSIQHSVKISLTVTP